MREISPAENLSAEQFLSAMPFIRGHVDQVRLQKQQGTRTRPSSSLIDNSKLLTRDLRAALLDQVAALVDENLTGRSDMCIQFALLLNLGLQHLGIPSRVAVGQARYFDAKRRQLFEWDHAWVRVGDEVIDGNTDSLDENLMVPEEVRVAPYWGPLNEAPPDRYLREQKGAAAPPDDDVMKVWWPDLRRWLDLREYR